MFIVFTTLIAFAASLVAVRIVERRAVAVGLVDVPNDRSLHLDPRPRGGGLGILVGTAAALSLLGLTGTHFDTGVVVVLAASLVIAATGLWDDLRRLPVLPRLVVQTVMAVLVVHLLGPFTVLALPAPLGVPLGIFRTPLTVAWLVGMTNFVNFMDGADGFAAGQATISLALLTWAAWPSSVALAALAVAAATTGFLPRNWSPAHIFLGDVGSSWLGFVLAALPLAAPVGARDSLAFTVAISLTLFLFDPALTLIRLAWRGHPIGVAHREHAYQRLIRRRGVHAPVVGPLLACAAALSLMAAAARLHPGLAWPAVASALAAVVVEFWWAARRD